MIYCELYLCIFTLEIQNDCSNFGINKYICAIYSFEWAVILHTSLLRFDCLKITNVKWLTMSNRFLIVIYLEIHGTFTYLEINGAHLDEISSECDISTLLTGHAVLSTIIDTLIWTSLFSLSFLFMIAYRGIPYYYGIPDFRHKALVPPPTKRVER